MKTGELKPFFDSHIHLLRLNHPSYLAGIENFSKKPGEMIVNQLLSPSYLLGSFSSRGRKRLENLFSAIDRTIFSILCLIEDDLNGGYGNTSIVENQKVKLLQETFSNFILIPMVIDFAQTGLILNHIAYSVPYEKKIDEQMEEVLDGIVLYRQARPNGIFEIYPFIGLTPNSYSAKNLEIFLDSWFPQKRTLSYKKRRLFYEQNPKFLHLNNKKKDLISGVKLYPPLGFNAWPDDLTERKKNCLLFDFCESKRIPLVTHCDDQGFKTIPNDYAMVLADPVRWKPVLKEYPDLVINFAHFGKQYYRNFGNVEIQQWFKTIVFFMLEYENIYADISFNGVDPRYYHFLANELNFLIPTDREIIKKRILFGSDFPMSLLLIDSYSAYLNRYELSVLERELKISMSSENPMNFIFGQGRTN